MKMLKILHTLVSRVGRLCDSMAMSNSILASQERTIANICFAFPTGIRLEREGLPRQPQGVTWSGCDVADQGLSAGTKTWCAVEARYWWLLQKLKMILQPRASRVDQKLRKIFQYLCRQISGVFCFPWFRDRDAMRAHP